MQAPKLLILRSEEIKQYHSVKQYLGQVDGCRKGQLYPTVLGVAVPWGFLNRAIVCTILVHLSHYCPMIVQKNLTTVASAVLVKD